MPTIFKDKMKAFSAAESSGDNQLLKTDFGIKIMQPDGISFFLKSAVPKPKLVKMNKGGFTKEQTDMKKTKKLVNKKQTRKLSK